MSPISDFTAIGFDCQLFSIKNLFGKFEMRKSREGTTLFSRQFVAALWQKFSLKKSRPATHRNWVALIVFSLLLLWSQNGWCTTTLKFKWLLETFDLVCECVFVCAWNKGRPGGQPRDCVTGKCLALPVAAATKATKAGKSTAAANHSGSGSGSSAT